jgi:hypothetical protein
MAFKRIFRESHFNIYDCIRLTMTNVMSDLAQARRERVVRQNIASILWFRGAQFWGTYQGYRHSSAVTQQLRQRFYYPGSAGASDGSQRDVQPIRYNQVAPGRGRDPKERT